jgi:hypothetical protein
MVIRDVPMHECDSCGETYMTTAVMKQLDGLVAQLLAGKADEAIARYPVAAGPRVSRRAPCFDRCAPSCVVAFAALPDELRAVQHDPTHP